MKISFNWLKQFLELSQSTEEIAEILTDIGLEVEGIETVESVKGSLRGIFVGKVVSCEKHPNADRLKVTTVDLGIQGKHTIVCGAPNVAQGQTVPVAMVGSTLYSKEGEAWDIKKSKIRGVESHGMICAEDEIGLGDSHEGIMILPDHYQIGNPLTDYYEVEEDTVFEIGLTPNRCDAMSHHGVARDLRAALMNKGKSLNLMTPSVSDFHVQEKSNSLKISIENPEKCLRYSGVVIRNLTIDNSPIWLQNRLKSIGLTPINNVVDVTNYVLHELGQPLHAFDYEKIEEKLIIVRTAKSSEKFISLDSIERELNEEDLMICDLKKPMCIGGVFGGLNSGVSKDTKTIFLESAYFDPVSIRKTAKRHGLSTDASFRFERGVNYSMTLYALKRAALLIKEIAGGIVCSEIYDIKQEDPTETSVFLSYEKVNKTIGEVINPETVKNILTSLEIKIVNVTESGMGIQIPAYRHDVKRDIDVVEEILRIYGYNEIAVPEKFTFSIESKNDNNLLATKKRMSSFFTSNGFYETMTNSLVAKESHKGDSIPVSLLNPLSGDLGILRTNLIDGMLDTLVYNQNRKSLSQRIFEFGKTYQKQGDHFIEQEQLGIAILGEGFSDRWNKPQLSSNFYALKGIIEALLENLNISWTYFHDDQVKEGLNISYNKKSIGFIGIPQQSLLNNKGVKSQVSIAALNMESLHKIFGEVKSIQFQPIPKYQPVKRDLALLLDKNITFSELIQIGHKAGSKYLKSIELFDVYIGEKLPEGKKSYALSLELYDNIKPMTDKSIDKVMNTVIRAYEEELKAVLR